MTTIIKADYDTYCAIEDMVYSILEEEEPTQSFEDVVTFAASLGVEFTVENWNSMVVDFNER